MGERRTNAERMSVVIVVILNYNDGDDEKEETQ